ncbi:hypothetical protein [Rugamonas aquatica]|uniref:Alpha/beta hydrolase n=1 Tax=Rugamonas aquatica TaxID=2743357 RepID=A0A6A7N9U7_9BURK|nr:hypothetical protein [Rugamonas aquatica]MQA41900.1 hypothetical protein [Rugamonas aquatica]
MTLRQLLTHAALATLVATPAFAARVLDEATLKIDGQERRYYHLRDTETPDVAQPIVLLSGSGCKDFGSRVPFFFERYPAPVDVYFLEKIGIQKGADGQACSESYNQADTLERRVNDTLAFIGQEPALKAMACSTIR